MKLDRALQKEILEDLAKHYSGLPVHVVPKDSEPDEEQKINANMLYLEAHGLIESGMTHYMDGGWGHGGASITHRGLDFLADDGGLSAILGVVTVKLHDDTIRDLIETRIQASDLPPAEKTGLLHQLRELRGESIKHLTMKLLDAGLENWPAALPLLQKSLAGIM
jgi:hypothetical protein